MSAAHPDQPTGPHRSHQHQFPQHASPSAAEHLSPVFPARAPWGTAGKLRAWQAEALDAYLAALPRDYLAVATPGSGKTTFALRVAAELLARRLVHKVSVVAPTEHLKRQWADAAARVGIQLDPEFRNSAGGLAKGYDGPALTYAQVAARPMLHRNRTENTRTLVILDEVHHGGDALSWGEAILEAFDPAAYRLCLTGTPFRSDTAAIPFVRYEPDAQGIRRSVPDFSYSYGRALRDGVVRPVLFLSYGGSMRWRTRAGDEVSASLGQPLTQDQTAQAWRTALDPSGDWMVSVLRAADSRLSEVRRAIPDAGGLVIATDQTVARAYASMLGQVTGEQAVVVVSDDADASARIEEFAAGEQRWMVAVRMVSEGVDVPRLAVGVYATSASTPLYFAQAVGRFVRARRRGETASVFLPTVQPLLELAGALELERDHALDRPARDNDDPDWVPEDDLLAAANAEEQASDDLLGSFEALEANAAFDSVMFDGAQYGIGGEIGSQEELDFLGLPGLLEPDQVQAVLSQRQSAQLRRRRRRVPDLADPADQVDEVATHRQLTEMRRELNSLVAAWSRVSGEPHAAVHAELRRRSGGGEVARASMAQIQHRIGVLRARLVKKG
ncbi:MAG: DEAD/DEAH box helicase [Actinomycetales bacterium]